MGTCRSMASRNSAAGSGKLPEVTGRVRTCRQRQGPHDCSGPRVEMQAQARYTRPRPPGLPTSAPPARGPGSGSGAQAAAGAREGRGKEGTTRLGAGEAAARSPRAGRGGGKRGEGKQRGRPFSYRGFLRNHGNDARPCACASRGAGRAAAPWAGPAHRRRSLWRGRGGEGLRGAGPPGPATANRPELKLITRKGRGGCMAGAGGGSAGGERRQKMAEMAARMRCKASATRGPSGRTAPRAGWCQSRGVFRPQVL